VSSSAPKTGVIPDFWRALFGSVETNDFRDRIAPGEDLSPVAPTDDPYARSYDEIISIQQKGSKGFRTFDVDPFNINQEDYPCQLTSAVLGNLFGFEDGAAILGYGADTNMAPFWRTVSIEANATWVRIEYLPNRTNDILRGAELGGGINIGPAIQPQTNGPTFPDIGTGITNISAGWPGKPSLTNAVILQFDDQNGSPVIAKHGDSFKIPFNTVYVTFKMWSPRFRILVGYNTEAVTVDDRMLMTRPAFAGGRGFLNNPLMHYVPFSLTAGDVAGVEGSSLTLPLGGALREDSLITNTGRPLGGGRFVDEGQGLLWVTGFTASVNAQSAALSVSAATFKTWLVVERISDGRDIRKVAMLLIPLNGLINCGQVHLNISEPVRVNLDHGCRLVLKTQCNSAQNLSFDFVVQGYVYGLIEGTTNPAGTNPLTPFIFTECMAEDPYSMDSLTLAAWPGGSD